MSDITARLQASIRMDAINGDGAERVVMLRQVKEAVAELARLTTAIAASEAENARLREDNATLANEVECGRQYRARTCDYGRACDRETVTDAELDHAKDRQEAAWREYCARKVATDAAGSLDRALADRRKGGG